MSAGGASPPGDKAVVTVTVAVNPPVAFEVFTEEIDVWWRQGPKYRMAGRGVGRIFLEAKLGGRLFETLTRESDASTREIGRVLAWEPPHRLVLEWRAANFAPGEKTEVEVRFDPSPSGTRVTVEHRGWSLIRADHPARHRQPVPKFIAQMGMWWGDLMTSLRELVADRADDAGSGDS